MENLNEFFDQPNTFLVIFLGCNLETGTLPPCNVDTI